MSGMVDTLNTKWSIQSIAAGECSGAKIFVMLRAAEKHLLLLLVYGRAGGPASLAW